MTADAEMSKPVKRSVTLSGHRTSISLEAEFWEALGDIAAERGLTVTALVNEIDQARTSPITGGLSSALRLYVLDHYRRLAQQRVR